MLMKMMSKVLVVSSILIGTQVFADSDHGHDAGPHGGVVKTFSDKHIEGVRSGDKVTIYLLDAAGKGGATIEKHEGGAITVAAPGNAPAKTPIAAGSNFSETSVSVPAKGKVSVIVNLKVKGKNISAKFGF